MLKKLMIFFFLLIAVDLNGMDADKKEQLRKYQELKEEREARKQSGQELQPKQDNSERSLPPYTEGEYQKRLIELETRLAEFEIAREIGKQQAAVEIKKMPKEELKAKLKRKEAELRKKREKEEARAQELLSKSIGDNK